MRLRRVESALLCFSPFIMSSLFKNLWFHIQDYWYRGGLNFVYIPDHVCVKILQHLEFKERVRLARVSRRFREMSDIALSQTKFLDLAASMFKKTTSESMKRLITLCAGSLERVNYGWERHQIFYRGPPPDDRLLLLSKFRCPHLVYLDLGGARIENDVLRGLLVSCPNLRHFRCDRPINTVFPVACETMEHVDVRSCEIGFLLSLSYRCLNLTGLYYVATNRKVGLPSEQILDETLANVPNLERLMLKLKCRSSPLYQCANMSGFMNLRSLRSLYLKCRGVTDESLRKISESLGQLESLSIMDRMDNNASLTGHGIDALSALEDLRDFSFMRRRWDSRPSIDDGIRMLASRGRLQRASFEEEIVSKRTVVTFVQRCRGLNELRVKDVQGILSPGDALEMLEGFQGFKQRKVAIWLSRPLVDWGRDELKAALDQFNASASGHSIKIYALLPDSVPISIHSWSEDPSDDSVTTEPEEE